MGQTLEKLVPGTEENKIKKITPIIDKLYENHFADTSEKPTETDFYQAICEIVEEINKQLGNTQFRVPKKSKLHEVFHEHHGNERSLTREEFQRILQEVIVGTGFTGVGVKDTLIYIFGVPLTALFIKQRIMPGAIPNAFFIPGITSATAFVLAKLNKI